ncbi:hypothetical protein GCM10011395_35640 [Sphingomonas psychrolutea]|uniref:Uncharacterized protein n=1 Tax=Sphingomonas psychrolutea TaxID=1259676 RepID=A0ABQ1H7F6_9SPHN|nr:hypothetical protein GCM10011395_35640 [Sphingomonas psychrolutea]
MLSVSVAHSPEKTKGPQVFPESDCRPGKSQSNAAYRPSAPKSQAKRYALALRGTRWHTARVSV